VVESQPSKLLVAGSIPVSRYALSASTNSPGCLSDVEGSERSESKGSLAEADVAQLAERVLGKDEVTSSILVIGSNLRSVRERRLAGQRGHYGAGERATDSRN
jgi:hypothetical protein